MPSHRAAAVVLALAACAHQPVLGERLRPGAPVVARPGAPRALEPHDSPVLVNPIGCVVLVEAGCIDAFSCGLLLAAIAGCAGVVTAVDLVALPVQYAAHGRQRRDLAAIAESCALEDPLPRIEGAVLAGLAEEHGVVAVEAGAAPPDALSLEAGTMFFTRSDRLRWQGGVVLRDPEGTVIFRHECDVAAPERSVEAIRADCDAARADLQGLADGCATSILGSLRKATAASLEDAATAPEAPSPAEGSARTDAASAGR